MEQIAEIIGLGISLLIVAVLGIFAIIYIFAFFYKRGRKSGSYIIAFLLLLIPVTNLFGWSYLFGVFNHNTYSTQNKNVKKVNQNQPTKKISSNVVTENPHAKYYKSNKETSNVPQQQTSNVVVGNKQRTLNISDNNSIVETCKCEITVN
ncbi:MAG: hypothetical protein FWD32_01510 [Firmicutes bacterium]|nr:hypothetical protein [Bacillota bacterium]